MTIALGFGCQEGWILGADSQETVSDYSKKTTRKIHLRDINDEWRLAFVLAGHGGYADMLQWQIEKSCNSASEFNFDVAEKIITAEVLSLHRKHLWPRASEGRPAIESLIAVQRKKEVWPVWGAIRVFATSDTSVTPVDYYHSIGIGAHMADYLRLLCSYPLMNAEAGERAAIYVLKEVKESIHGCGDKSVVCFLSATGSFRFTTNNEFEPIEKSFVALNDALQEIFKICLNPHHITFESDLRIVNQILMDVRNKQIEVQQARDELYRQIRESRQKKKTSDG